MQDSNKKRVIIIAAVGTLVFGCVITGVLLPDPKPNDSQPRDFDVSTPVRTTPRESKWYVRTENGVGSVPVAKTLDALKRLEQLSAAKDYVGINDLILRGQVFYVDSGTEVTVIDRGFFRNEIRPKEGPREGESCWVASHLLNQEGQ